MLEDRLSIKSTQRLKRHITAIELSKFFMQNRGKIENIHKTYLKELDKLINDYLEGLK